MGDWLKILLIILPPTSSRLKRQRIVYAVNSITVALGLSILIYMVAVAVLGSTFVDPFG